VREVHAIHNSSQSYGSYRVLSFHVSSLLTIFLNSPVDRRRSQDLPMLIDVSVSTTPSVIAGQRLCQSTPRDPEQPRVKDSRTVAWCNIMDNRASPQIANTRAHCRKLGGCASKKHRPKLQGQHLSPHLSSSHRRHRLAFPLTVFGATAHLRPHTYPQADPPCTSSNRNFGGLHPQISLAHLASPTLSPSSWGLCWC
jgi:hypothetical protein